MLKRVKHSRKLSNYHRRLFIEPLEPRRLLATLLTGGKTVTYQDVDGDTVTVALSKAVLTSGNVNSVFTFATGSVNGDNGAPQQLELLDLTQLGAAAAAGTNITITAKPSAIGNFNFGDGFANVGFINGTGINLGTVSVHGDLGRIDAGDGTSATLGLTSLTIHSMGAYGTTTQTTGGNLKSTIEGKLGALNVAGDIDGAYIDVEAGANSAQVPGTIGAVTIGGSLLGVDHNNNEGGPNDSGNDDGVIFAAGSIGPISIKGSIQGRTGILSDHDSYSGLIYTAHGNIGSVKIGGSVVGGNGALYTGSIVSGGNMGAVTIGGSLVGNGGDTAEYSGAIYSSATMGNVTIGGSLVGGGTSDSGGTTDFSGFILSVGNMGAVAVGCSVVGSVSFEGAFIGCDGTMASVKIGGSVQGGGGLSSGSISSAGNLGPVTIGQDLQGGGGLLSGDLKSNGNLGNITIGGSLTNGDIIGGGIIGQVKIGGSIVGATISALGQATPKSPNDLAIAGLTVGEDLEFANIFAGYSFDGTNFNPTSADAQIGNVSVGGDWIASNLLAGAKPTGSGQFEKITGGTDNAAITSSIASIAIAGEVMGTLTVANDSYGFAAELVKSLTIGGTKIKLLSGLDNDYFAIGTTADVALQEV